MSEIVKKLSTDLAKSGLSQNDFANKLGVSNSNLSEVLNGKRKINIKFAQKLHMVLKYDASFLLINS